VIKHRENFTFLYLQEYNRNKDYVSQSVSRIVGLRSTGLHSSFATDTKLEESDSLDTSRILPTGAAYRTRVITSEVATRWPLIPEYNTSHKTQACLVSSLLHSYHVLSGHERHWTRSTQSSPTSVISSPSQMRSETSQLQLYF
jgi:hypothetical protein